MKLTEKKKLILIHIVYVLALVVILWPLLAISQYNYPSADDWTYGANTYRAISNHEGILNFIKTVIDTVRNDQWEARFMNITLATLQPGIFGEHCYAIVAWLMIGSVIFSEMFLVAKCIGKENRGLILPISVPVIILQLLYCPSPEESFYWYTGAVNYTFVYSVSLVLMALFLKLTETMRLGKRIVMTVLAVLLAVIVGGDNFATSLSTMCLMLCLEILFLIRRRDALKRTWIVTLTEILCVLKCVTSPLTATRINGNFGGNTANTPVMAILLSFERTFLNVISWTNLKVLFMLLLILPFLWKAVRKMSYSFRLPGVFTALSFGIYSSQATATLYVDGTMGGGRQGAILWYFYVLWLVANVMYWCGWIAKHVVKEEKAERTDEILKKYLLRYCAVTGAFLAAAVLFGNVQSTTSYRAYRMWRNGWAQAYGAGWEERLKVLKDDSVKNPVFTPLNYVELIMYTDLQPENGYVWVNTACAEYYGKESVTVAGTMGE